MSGLFYAFGIFILFFALIYTFYGQFAVEVVRWCKPIIKSKSTGKIKAPSISTEETIKCYIPIYQAVMVWKALYKTASVWKVLSIVDAALIFVSLFIKFILPINSLVMFIATIMVYIGVILHIVIYSVITAKCARLYGYGWFTTLGCILLPHVFCYTMKAGISKKMRTMHEEARFDEHRSDTVIKSRPNKR